MMGDIIIMDVIEMRVLVQRSLASYVNVSGDTVGKIDKGIVAFVGFTEGDSEEEIDYLVSKLVHLRIFDDENGVMNRSIADVGGSVLSISQFTLYADASKGRRPSYVKALNGDKAILLYELWNQKLKSCGMHVEAGVFGEDMEVHIVNDGPVTILLEKEG